MRQRKNFGDPSSSEGLSSQSIRHSIFEARCKKELSDLKSSNANEFIELDEPSLESESYNIDGQTKAYRIEIRFKPEFFRDVRERYFKQNPSCEVLDTANPMKEMAEFWLEIYNSYPFEPPQIQCIRFPSYLPGTRWLQFSPPSMIQFVMGESWLPLITLKILINRLIQCVEQSAVDYLQDIEYIQSLPKSSKGIKFRKLLNSVFRNLYNSRVKQFTILFSVITLIILRFFMVLNLSDLHQSEALLNQWNWMINIQNNSIVDWYKIDPLALSEHPPLFALYSYCISKIISLFETISIHSNNKGNLINLSIILSELLLLFSGAILYWIYNPLSGNQQNVRQKTSWVKSHVCLFIFLSCPTFFIIDYTQFNYTCVTIGLLIWSICFLSYRQYSLAAAVFTMALLFDKMTLLLLFPFLNFLIAMSGRRLIATGIKTDIQLQKWRKFIPQISMIILSFMAILVLISFPFKLYQELSFIEFLKGVLPIWNFSTTLNDAPNFPNFSRTIIQLPNWAQQLPNMLAVLFLIPSNLDLMLRPTFQRFILTLFSTSLSIYIFSTYSTPRLIVLPLLFSFLLFTKFARASLLFSILSFFTLLPQFKQTHQIIFWSILFIIWYTLASNSVSIFDPKKSYPPKYKSWFSLMRTITGLSIRVAYNYLAYFITSSLLGQLIHTVSASIINAIKDTYTYPSTHPFILNRCYLKLVRFVHIMKQLGQGRSAHSEIYLLYYRYHSNNLKKMSYALSRILRVIPTTYYYTSVAIFFLFICISGIIIQFISINNSQENWSHIYISGISTILLSITLWSAYFFQKDSLAFDQLSIVDQSNPILTPSKSIPPEFIPSTYQPLKID